MNARRIILFVFLLALLLSIAPAFAQDEPPIIPIFQPPTLRDVQDQALQWALALFAGVLACPLTAPLVSLIKRVPFLQKADGTYKVSSNVINLSVALSLSGLYWLGQALGYLPQVEKGFALLGAILPILVSTGGNYAANKGTYFLAKGRAPIVGYQRPPKVNFTISTTGSKAA